VDGRAALVRRLERSLHVSGLADSPVAEAWRAEIASRIDGILDGRVGLLDAAETHRLLSAELADTPH
jgi:hypothetical protein